MLTQHLLIEREPEIKKVKEVFHAITHPLRKRILQLLEEKQEAKVTDIYVYLRIEQSVASFHLRILRDAKLVVTERKGKLIFYKLNYANLVKLEKIVDEVISDIVTG